MRLRPEAHLSSGMWLLKRTASVESGAWLLSAPRAAYCLSTPLSVATTRSHPLRFSCPSSQSNAHEQPVFHHQAGALPSPPWSKGAQARTKEKGTPTLSQGAGVLSSLCHEVAQRCQLALLPKAGIAVRLRRRPTLLSCGTVSR